MRLGIIALAGIFLTPAPALAGLITFDDVEWTRTTEAGGPPFWAGVSWDCPTCGIGDLLEADSEPELEYLNDGTGGPVGFRFDDAVITPTLLFSITGWKDGVLDRRADGAFTYDSNAGRVSNSWDNGGQYALFRVVSTETTQYILGIEDMLLSEALNDRDYNDYVVSFELEQPVSMPEPSTLVLVGSSLAAIAVRRRLANRRRRSAL